MNDDRGLLASTAPGAKREHRWNQRAFVTTGALLSGLALPLSGLADHAAGGPGGFVVGWSVVHTSLGAIFAGFCVWHAALNRRALLRHLRADALTRPRPSREVLVALVLVGGVLAFTVAHALLGP